MKVSELYFITEMILEFFNYHRSENGIVLIYLFPK